MIRPHLPRLLAVCATAVCGAAAAATGPADDAAVRLSPPRLNYISAFTPSLRHADAPRVEWSRSNALVGALKGHAGHLRGPVTAPEGDAPTTHNVHGAHGHGAGAGAR